jgi:hypothetical protein
MKSSRLGWLVGGVLVALLVLTGVAVLSLVQLGSGMLALVVGLAGATALAAVAIAFALVRQAEQQLGELVPALPADAAPVAPAAPAGKGRVMLREARPGEVPEPYLDAVMRGAQARRAAWKASADQP